MQVCCTQYLGTAFEIGIMTSEHVLRHGYPAHSLIVKICESFIGLGLDSVSVLLQNLPRHTQLAPCEKETILPTFQACKSRNIQDGIRISRLAAAFPHDMFGIASIVNLDHKPLLENAGRELASDTQCRSLLPCAWEDIVDMVFWISGRLDTDIVDLVASVDAFPADIVQTR